MTFKKCKGEKLLLISLLNVTIASVQCCLSNHADTRAHLKRLSGKMMTMSVRIGKVKMKWTYFEYVLLLIIIR